MITLVTASEEVKAPKLKSIGNWGEVININILLFQR